VDVLLTPPRSLLKDFPQPEEITSLWSFIDMDQQMGTFMPDLSHETRRLREHLKKEREFMWLSEHI
jgi:hypothetical protein